MNKKQALENKMPLIKGEKAKTRSGFSENVRREMKTKPKNQALAIAYSLAKENKKKK